MSNSANRRLRRLGAGAAVGALVTTSLLLGSTPAGAADEIGVFSHNIDLTETRATGHNEFTSHGAGVRVWTEASTSTDKAAGYFDVNVPLDDAGEPSMSWSPNGTQTLKPSVQLKTDFDGDGNIDGILVGEPTYANGTPLYGNDWWLSNGSEQFVKDAAPSHVGGSGSENHGTLAQWRDVFTDAVVVQGGWSLGSGVKGDGVIHAIVIGGTPYYFRSSEATATVVKYENDVDLSQTRAKGHNEFRAIGGVRVFTDPSDCTDPNPAGGTYCANKAAGYFPAAVDLDDAGEPAMDYTPYSGLKPSVQLVTDFDGNGTPDGILVGETVYGRDWWVPGSAAQFVKDGAPSHTGGSGSENHGLLTEWRGAFPDAKILAAGWSLGSGAVGDGVIRSITVGLTQYAFSGANRAPVAADHRARTASGTSVSVTLSGTDADGDPVTYTAAQGIVNGDQLTYSAPAGSVGTKTIAFTVVDSHGSTDQGRVTIRVTKARSQTTMVVKPAQITTNTANVRSKITVTSTGLPSGGLVTLYDGSTEVGSGVVNARGKVKIKLTEPLKKGRHTLKARFAGTASTTASQIAVKVTVVKG